jgi:RimJ/RimL family protein N-acetyltransferase
LSSVVAESTRQKIIRAASDLYSTIGVLNISRREIAKSSGYTAGTVTAVAKNRSEFLRLVIAAMPYSSVTKSLDVKLDSSENHALHLLLAASRDIWGDPASAWDPVELSAMAGASYDEGLREILAQRIEYRWEKSRDIVLKLREHGLIDPVVDLDSVVLHIIAVGVGIAMLAPTLPVNVSETHWTALSARLLESLAVTDPVVPHPGELPNYWRIRTRLQGVPSATARLLRVLSLLNVAVAQLTSVDLTSGEQQIDTILKAPQNMDRATLRQAIESVGRDVIVARGNENDTVDVATRVLRLSSVLATTPASAPQAAADLVLAQSWEIVRATSGENSSEHVLRLQWTVDHHVILRRERAPFTQIEYQRASALLELIEALITASGVTSEYGWVDELTDNTPVLVRLARPEDTAAVEALHKRSSEKSIYQRYFTPKNSWREENLRRVSGGHRGITLVVTDRDNRLMALANIFPLSATDLHTGEIAYLVEDQFQGQGIGNILLEHSQDLATRLGFTKLVAYVLNDNAIMRKMLLTHDWVQVPAPEFGPAINAFEKIMAG